MQDAVIRNLCRVSSSISTDAKRIVILASGGGSNAECIINHFAEQAWATVTAVVSDRKAAHVHQRAARLGVPSRFVGRTRREREGGLLEVLQAYKPDLIVLAGYLRLVPLDVLRSFAGRVLNIHPALLPKYAGPGMYGEHVHQAVAAAGDAQSGITIHLADARYDEGRVLFQASTPLAKGSTPDEIAQRVLALEHLHFPLIIASYLQQLEPNTNC